ncbi:MAG: DUF1080 domain-containing protein [Verrucomicrobiota bacterium]
MRLVLLFLLLSVFVAGSGRADDHVGFTELTELSQFMTEGNWVKQEDGSFKLVNREGEEGWKRYHHYLYLKETYQDFEFDFEYQHPEGGNSGLYFRITDTSDPVTHGWEVQILDSLGKPDAEMTHHDNGGIIKTKPADTNASIAPGEWNRMILRVEGTHVHVTLNGKVVQDFDITEQKPEGKEYAPFGAIGIQDHGTPFAVRNLRVKRLGETTE